MNKVVIKNQTSVIGKKMDNNCPFGYLSKKSDRWSYLLINKLSRHFKDKFNVFLPPGCFSNLILGVLILGFSSWSGWAQQYYQQQYYNPQAGSNYLRNSQAFRQEIARFEITVHRDGQLPLSLSQVPRVEEGDVIKVKLLDEAVNGVKLDQSFYDWTLLVAFINPNRKFVDGQGKQFGAPEQKNKPGVYGSVSEEIRFRQKGWYKEHSFVVPYDSQPVLFLYPRSNYRSKILGLINKNYNEIRKLGEKTIDLAGAYGQISLFLNELQGVLSGNGGFGNGVYGSGSSGGYNPYPSNVYRSYNPYYGGYTTSYNYNLLVSQSVERLARSFNIQLPQNCWPNGSGYSSGNYGSGYGTNQNGISPEMVNRLQCVAKSIRLEDFDLSVARLLQQGGILLAAQLQQKYPQIAHWINVAALAIDFIVKVFNKTPMRVVPTVTSSADNPSSNGYGSPGSYQGYQGSPYSGNPANSGNTANYNQPMPKISLFAENQPDDNQFVTAYPLILHKWQAEPDAEVISLRPPVLMEPCLHAGTNVLKSTDLTEDQLSDNFTKDYVLTMTSTNGFKKEFPLKKNIGLGGWELTIQPQELQEFPKIPMNLESVIKGKRGFNEIKSPPFFLPIALGGSWQLTPESQQNFTVGGRRTVTIKNTLGNCQCLQAVIYRPSFGGQFVFEADSFGGNGVKPNNDDRLGLQYSPDGKEVSFEVDATNFQPGDGKVELRTFGGERVEINLKLYPLPPHITNLKIGKGDREAIIGGERLEQIQSIRVNGRRAIIVGSQSSPSLPNYQSGQSYPNQPNSVNPVNSVTSNSVNAYIPNLLTNNPNERIIVFEDANAKITENIANLELNLEDNRTFQVVQTFTVSPARPAIAANELKEVEGVALKDEKEIVIQNSTVMVKGAKDKKQKPKTKDQPSLDLSKLSVFPMDTDQISLNIQNALTDYDFRFENLSIETRLEKNQVNNPGGYQVPYNPAGNGVIQNSGETSSLKVEFEVLDWKNLRINLQVPEQLQKMLGGRRLQFRLRDKDRGDSDWYTIKQTFVRIPAISSIICTQEMNGMCEMKGVSVDYISQVSVDGGLSWYPQSPATLQIQSTQDGQKLAVIPNLQNKKLLMIKLRDFPNGNGLFINQFTFSNLVKGWNKTVLNNGQGQTPNQTVQPNPIPNPGQKQPVPKKVTKKRRP